MNPPRDRYQFASDNTAAICPEAWAALEEANTAAIPSYGEDRWTRRVCDLVREIFETPCEVFLVFNGTAANSLALAQLVRPFEAILCHERAHIHTDECGAPEFFAGGAKLLPLRGENGKLTCAEVEALIARHHDLHSSKPAAISLTQATELGTVYTRDEIAALSEVARRHGLFLQMDGARFANAIVSLDCAPKSITWEAGVDVLSFGGVKNGGAVGELVVFFDEKLARDFDYRAKQAGQLASKMRALAAPWVGLLENDVWLKNARNANARAKSLAAKLETIPGVSLAFPCEANAIFAHLPEQLALKMSESGWHFYKFIEPDIYRFMCSWALTENEVNEFVDDLREAAPRISIASANPK